MRTIEFQINNEELALYDELTRYVQDQSIRASQEDSPRGRTLQFTMAMLQRRFASSIYAVRRSLERMRAKREKILKNPEAWRAEQISKHLPENYDELPDEELQALYDDLEGVVASVDPAELREEIECLTQLINRFSSLVAILLAQGIRKMAKPVSERDRSEA